MLEALSFYFPVRIYSDVLEAYAGIRVLRRGNGEASSRCRETMLITDRTFQLRLLSILGGKLSAYRATAEKVLSKISTSLPRVSAIADMRSLALAPVDAVNESDHQGK